MRLYSTRLVIAAASAAAGVAIVAGCGGGPTNAEAAPAPGPVMPGMASIPEAPVATNVVSIENFAYSPAIATIKSGTTVTWTNRDQDPHTVTAMSGPFHSPVLNTGQSFRHTFTAPGRFDYLCTIHPFMTATVVVTT